MNKKKGFTLVELIAVISLIAIVVLIAGLSIIKIKDNVTKGERDNLRTTIKIAAKEYHEETGIDKIPVQILIQTGKISADEMAEADINNPRIKKGEPIIYDPVDHKIINCEYVDFSDSEDGKWKVEDGCTPEILAAHAIVISYNHSDSKNVTIKSGIFDENAQNDWYAVANGESFTLSSALKDDEITESMSYLWTTPSAPDLIHDEKTLKVEVGADNLVDLDYHLDVQLDSKSVSTDMHIKLDGTYPLAEDVYVTDADEWAKEKYLHANLSDTGSGLYGYSVVEIPAGGTLDTVSCNTAEYTTSGILGSTNYELHYKIPANTSYVLCVKDNSGNTLKYAYAISVHRIDDKAPTIKVSVTNPEVFQIQNTAYITIKENGLDNANISGFAKLDGESVKYYWSETPISACPSSSSTLNLTYNASKGEYYGQVDISGKTGKGAIYVCPVGEIRDNAGNIVSNAPASSKMFLDSTAPSGKISITSTVSSHNVLSAKYSVSNLKDQTNGSGLDSFCVSDKSMPENCKSWKTPKDTTVAYTFSGSEGSGETYTLYLHIKDVAGNIYTTSTNYKIYKYCTKTSSTTSCGSCSASCGGGTKSCTTYSYDYYNGNVSCGTSTSRDSCNTRSCPASDPYDYPSSSGGSSSSGSTCDNLCQMQKNSAEWNRLQADSQAHPENAAANKAKQDALHETNMGLKEGVSQCGTGCTYDEHAGTYSTSNGNRLY